jgi:serine/threonine-protein kinase
MPDAALQKGELFANRYRIVRELASGGMGAVYEVVHTVTERRCALKVMLAHTVEREQLRKRFMLESRLAAQIGSEYIVDVLDAGVDEATKAPYLVMELLEGEDLGQRLLRLGPLSREDTVSYLWHVALALDRTHQAGIVHRDLKASNLFLTRREDGTPLVKVLDFGVAKVLTMERSGEQRTQTVGTPIYMAPEQFRAEGRISPATDIYALGMLSYTLLVGVHYWSREHEHCENPFAFASIAVHGPKDEPSIRAAREHVDLPPEFDAWFFRSTCRWPQDRFPCATNAVADLAKALGVPVPEAPGAPSTSSLEPKSGGRGPAGGLLPATIEAPSARVSGPGSRSGASSGASLRTEASGSEAPPSREQHTEVSLSVTSGGQPFALGEPKPRRGRVFAIGAAVAAAAAVVAAAVGLSHHSVEREGSKPAPAVQPAATVTPLAFSALPEPPPVPAADHGSDVTRIEELPIAPPEARGPARAPGEEAGPRRAAATGARPRSHAAPRGGAPSSQPGAALPAEPAVAPAPKSLDRESLYGRD